MDRSSRRCTTLLVGVVLVATGCTVSTSTTPAPTATATTYVTPAEQAAALVSTSGYRAAMAEAGQQLAAALDAQPVDRDAMRLALDVVRPQIEQGPSGGSLSSDPGAASLEAVVAMSASREQIAALVSQAATIEVLLSRVILSPSAIALSAQRSCAWIAAEAPGALGRSASSSVTVDDLGATARAVQATVSMLEPLGSLVAPGTTESVRHAVDALVAAVGHEPPGSTRVVVAAADRSLAVLGTLGGALAGYGQGGQY